MAARVVCGSQPDAAVRSASVAPSGRETASSSTASLPPGRAEGDPGRRHRRRRRLGRGHGGSLGAALDTDGVETGGGDHQALALARVVFLDDPLRLPGPALDRGLGDQAAADQRAQRALEGGALQRERLGRGQDAQIGAGGGGREQNRLGVGELRHDFGPFVRGGAGLRGLPLTEGPVSGRSRAGPGPRRGRATDTHALRQAEVQRRLGLRQRFLDRVPEVRILPPQPATRPIGDGEARFRHLSASSVACQMNLPVETKNLSLPRPRFDRRLCSGFRR